jgi:serine protease Do
MRFRHYRILAVGLVVRRASLRLAAIVVFLFVMACTQSFAQTPQPPKCSPILSNVDLENCRRLADAGSTAAMMTLAEGYARGFHFFNGLYRPASDIPPNPDESLRYYMLAADLGNDEALRRLVERYSHGDTVTVSKNRARAEAYLNKAAQFGSEWAILLLAQGQEKFAPAKALEAYLRLARNDNCVAQMRLVDAYESGVLVKKNLTQAYFWVLLAMADGYKRKADLEFGFTERLQLPSKGYREACSITGMTYLTRSYQLKKMLPAKLAQAAQDAATNWTKGSSEKLLPAPEPPKAVAITPPKAPAPGSNASPNLTMPRPPVAAEPEDDWIPGRPSLGPSIQTAKWTPLSKDFHPPKLRNKQSAEELFTKASSSVWVVIAAASMPQTDAASHVSQGSAVAITRSHLLTNYHVIDGQRFFLIKQGDNILEATVVAGDKQSDRSVLQVKGEPLNPVNGLRGFEDLRVGEQVYTIGSPSALESTLGQGIVSGLRTVAGQHLVQTTAPISPGSSGGGLFDSAGNLIGITSFVLKNSQGLNFAIAADDYFR